MRLADSNKKEKVRAKGSPDFFFLSFALSPMDGLM